MILPLILLAASFAPPDSVPAGAIAREISTADRPAVVVHRQPSVPVVSIRLSVLANDPPGYSGAGHMIQHLALPTLQERVSRVGGRVQMQRTADAIVYTVTGPSSELEFLSESLAATLNPPTASPDALLRIDRLLREARLAEWELAAGHVRSTLRAQIFPTDLSAAGTDRSATRLTGAVLPRLWRHMYRPDRVSIVAVGDVFLGDVQRVFSNLPAPPDVPELVLQRDSVMAGSLAPPQATRAWFGAGYLIPDDDPASATVTAHLLGNVIRARLPTAQVDAEHWWSHHGMAIVLVVAVPERDMVAARRVMGTAVSTLRSELSFVRATDAAVAIRREMLFSSRTPDRMAELVGQFVDREGDPNATERYYARLDELDDRDVRAILDRMTNSTPARVEIPPQALQPRRR